MDSENLYRVQREDLPKLEKLLNLCFAHDPLYETLIPNAEIRKKLMPELFHCDMDEFYETCEQNPAIFSAFFIQKQKQYYIRMVF